MLPPNISRIKCFVEKLQRPFVMSFINNFKSFYRKKLAILKVFCLFLKVVSDQTNLKLFFIANVFQILAEL